MSQAELNNFEVISLLCWKSMNVYINKRLSFIFSILSPATFIVFMIFLRFTIHSEYKETTSYNPIAFGGHWRELLKNNTVDFHTLKIYTKGEFNYNVFVAQNALAYTPNNNKAIDRIMESAVDTLGGVKLHKFKNSKALRDAMVKHHYVAGIVFKISKSIQSDTETIPSRLIFTLVYPSEIRDFWDNCIGSHWRTNDLFDPYDKYFGRFPDNNDGGYVGYFREGFVALQHELSLAYISLKNGKDKSKFPLMFMQRFANPASKYDTFLEKINCCLSLTILMGYLYPTTYLIKFMVHEKSLLLKDALNIYGLSETIQFVAWFINGLVQFFVASIIALPLLKVHWEHGCGIFTKSSWTAFIVFMLTYNIASVCFCYLVSTFFQSPSAAVMMHSIAWALTYFPYTVTILRLKRNAATLVMVALFSNAAMAMGIRQITDLEKYGDGLQWKNMFYTNEQGETLLPIGTIVLILLGQAVIYTLIGITIEKVKKKAWFNYCVPCSLPRQLYLMIRNYFKGKSTPIEPVSPRLSFSELYVSKSATSLTQLSPINVANKSRSKIEVIEIESANKNTVVEVKNLCLIINNITIVDSVSMDLYENEISVLMGTNGSGKSMLLSMIIGRIPATSGSVRINGVNVINCNELDHSFVRVSLNDDMLYPDLTVHDQIAFFSSMSGFRGDRLHLNVKKYLRAMHLSSKANQITHTLTRGVKQRLCASCALCGNSKFVIMDEPSSSMDMSARKILWDLLLKEKRRRTILITTQSTEEAEIIADRIGIMSGGKLKCFGSPYFLKSFYGTGKRLSCAKDVNCDIEAVTKFMRIYIPEIKPESNLGNELTYKIVEENLDTMVALLTDIEKSLKDLKLNSFTITELTFEDIFLHMCEDDTRAPGKTSRLKRLVNGFTKYISEYESLFFLNKEFNKPSKLKEMRAIFLRRWYYIKGNMLFGVMHLILPVLIVYLSILVPSSDLGKESLKPMTYQLSQYESSVSVIERKNKKSKFVEILADRYEKLVDRLGSVHRIEDTGASSMTEYMLSEQRLTDRTSAMYLVGATFSEKQIVAWFNNYPLHTIPLSLNMVHNAILQVDSPSSSISVTLEPLPFTTSFDPDQTLIQVDITNTMEFYIAFVMSFVCGMTTLKIIFERITAFKLLLYVNGLQPAAYLIGNLLFDMLKFFIIGITVFVIIEAASGGNKDEIKISIYFVIMLTIFAFAMLNFCHCMATFFKNPLTGNIAVLLFTVYGGVFFVAFSEIHQANYTYIIDFEEKFIWFLRIFPVFALCEALNKIIGAVELREVCADKNFHLISVALMKCKVNPNCCIEPDLLQWDNLYCIIPDIIFISAFGIICMIFHFLVEYNTDFMVSSFGYRNKTKESLIFDNFTQMTQKTFNLLLNASVGQEKHIVLKLQPGDYLKSPLVMRNVSKSFGKGVAIHQLYLKIDHGECFGILGVNGSGKTAIIKLLTGHEMLTAGQVYVKGCKMNKKLYDMYKHTGLCPKAYTIPQELTVYQIMKILCVLRGIPNRNLNATCESLGKVLGFINYLHVKYGKLSSGNKLRICAAISMIGSPTIMYYDVATSGIDPAGRRQLWNIFGRMLKKGKSVFFTSHNTEECARICTRVAILDRGTFQYLDTPHNLSHDYMNGCLLYIQVKPKYIVAKSRNASLISEISDIPSEISLSSATFVHRPSISPITRITSPFLKVQTFVEQTFTNAIVKDQRGNAIIFYIPGETTLLSDIYQQIGRNAFNLNVANFSLSRTTLEMLFCDLADNSEERTHNREVVF